MFENVHSGPVYTAGFSKAPKHAPVRFGWINVIPPHKRIPCRHRKPEGYLYLPACLWCRDIHDLHLHTLYRIRWGAKVSLHWWVHETVYSCIIYYLSYHLPYTQLWVYFRPTLYTCVCVDKQGKSGRMHNMEHERGRECRIGEGNKSHSFIQDIYAIIM